MTSQTHKFVELSDIVGFRFTCRECGISFSIPAFGDNKVKATKLDKCPGCDEPWLTLPNGSTMYQTFSDLWKQLRELKRQMDDRDESVGGFHFALEIGPDIPEDLDKKT